MPLPTSFPISTSDIRTELGYSPGAQVSILSTDSRGVTGIASGSVAFSNFLGKSRTSVIEYFIVAGGGAGGGHYGGGGGAGGILTNANYSITKGYSYNIVVGAGGVREPFDQRTVGPNGSNSSFYDIVALGGGGGAASSFNGNIPTVGGSGGGSAADYDSEIGALGTAGQGYAGSKRSQHQSGTYYGAFSGGGGGGAGGAGNGGNDTGGAGGIGIQFAGTYYGGGGGGGGTPRNHPTNIYGGPGGLGGGGRGGALAEHPAAADGAPNTGGGGGGGGTSGGLGGSGGSGIVILRYPNSYKEAITVSGGYALTNIGGYRVYTFTSNGSITF